ncbi:MAG: hypothetical protein M1829_003254 [Trizodia sp. TS-e1964]|nr:MAG: hypothetical protein M1829_003254 [Trizodia sp. TS-e1964]
MDPLSIISGAIAVGTLASETCKAFALLRSICKTLPGRMHALNNEVADIEVVLNQVAKVFEGRAATSLSNTSIADTGHSDIESLLDKARKKLTELRVIIEGLAKTIENPAQDMMHIRVELQSLSAVTSQIPDEQNSLRDEVLTSIAYHHRTVEQRIDHVEDLIRAQSEQLKANQDTQVGPLYQAPPPYRRRASRKGSQGSIRSEGVGVRVNQYTSNCRTGCACSCHTQKNSSSSSFLNRVVGRIFVGYAGLPVVSPKCDNASCEKSQTPSVSVEYWFPLGFCWSQIVRLQIGYRPHVGPHFNLTTLRRVPDTAPCVEFALNGDTEALKGLFKLGLASPWDVSTTRGYTLIRWALYGKQYQTVKFLVQAGADADYKPISPYDNNPRNKASDIVLQGGLSQNDVDTLRCLTEGNDWLDEQNFSLLHKIVCGLSLKSLEQEILAQPKNIDCVDALGRTPLLWASARGDATSVATLLLHGADPNILDNQLAPPVSYAADRGHAICVRLLLEAGAEPDPVMPNGYKGGSALNCAARNATDPLILKTLLDFGADIESSGVDGRTSLIHVARTDNVTFAILLLEYGADLNAISTSNQTPLTTAIINNSHNVLSLLLERWDEYSECPRLKGPHLLQIAALYADVYTLKILSRTNHFQINYDKDFLLGDFAERLKGRHDVSDELLKPSRSS